MFGSVNPWCGEPPTGEPYAGEPHVRFGGRGDRATDLPYPYRAVAPYAWFENPTMIVG